jgi:hypothetical protein
MLRAKLRICIVASVLTLIAIGMDGAGSLNRPAAARKNQRLGFTLQITQKPPT